MPDIVTRMVLRGWGVGVVVVSAVAVVVAGCTGDGEAEVTPTPTLTAPVIESPEPSPSPTPSPTPTVLTKEEVLEAIPPGAQNEDFYSAQLFAEFFVSEFPMLFQEPYDGRVFQALSSPDCVFCQSAINNQAEARGANAVTSGGAFEFPEPFATGGLRGDGTWLVEHKFHVEDTEYFDREGTLYRTTPGGTGVVHAHLEWTGDHWVALGVRFEYDDDT